MITIPGKIPITIHPLFWLLALFIGFMSTFTIAGTLMAMAVILISVLFHEFGHALTALLFQQKVRITLAAFGGFTYREGRKLKLWEEFLVVLNGPLAGLLLGVIAWIGYTSFPISNLSLLFTLKFAALVNLFWTIINLIPLLPLDGGHLLSIILEAIFGVRGIKAAIVTGLVIGVGLSAFFLIKGAFLLGALFVILTFESFRSFKYYKMLTTKDRDESLQKLLNSAESDLEKGQVEEALNKLEQVRQKTGSGLLYTTATQEKARIYRFQERYKEGYETLLPIKKDLSPELFVLFQFLAFKNEDYLAVTSVSEQTFQQNPTHEVALMNALAFGAQGKREAALGWLECAQREGLPSTQEVLKRKEFDPLRQDPHFQKFVNAVSSSR